MSRILEIEINGKSSFIDLSLVYSISELNERTSMYGYSTNVIGYYLDLGILIPFENKSFVINFQMNERMIYNIRQASTSDYEGIEKQFYEKVKIFQQELVAVWKEDLVKNKISFSGI